MKVRLLESTPTLHVLIEQKTDLTDQELLLSLREKILNIKLVIIDLKPIKILDRKEINSIITFAKKLKLLEIEIEVVNVFEKNKAMFDLLNAQYYFAYGRTMNSHI